MWFDDRRLDQGKRSVRYKTVRDTVFASLHFLAEADIKLPLSVGRARGPETRKE